jgi:uncharacterized membrane protein YccF (DUF307 family)
MAIIFIISLLTGIGYHALILSLFGVPKSISESFYLLNARKRGLGWLFYAWAAVTVFTVCPIMFQLSDGQWYQFLALFTGAGLLLAGAEPHFKEERRRKVHLAGAGTCASSAVLWLVFAGYWYIPVIISSVAMIISSLGNLRNLGNLGILRILTGWENLTYRLETALILSMYVTLFIIEIWKIFFHL